MSVLNTYRSQLLREQDDAVKDQRAVSDASQKIAQKQGELRRTRAATRQKALQSDIDRLTQQRAKAEQSLALRQKKVADLSAKVAREERKEQERAEQRARRDARGHGRSRREAERTAAAALDDLRARVAGLEDAVLRGVRDAVTADPRAREHDVFLSHAGPDKEAAGELYAELVARGLDVWFDGAELRLGGSLTRQIDRGIAASRVGVVLITEAFLGGREWTEREVGGLFSGRWRVIPVLEGVGFEDLARYSPLLADLVGLSTEAEGMGEIAERIANTLADAVPALLPPGAEPPRPPAVGGAADGDGDGDGRRQLGRDVGVVLVAEDFDAPLPDDVLTDFER